MKTAALLFSALAALAGDVTPHSSSVHPKRLAEERSFPAPGLWLISPGGKFIATEGPGDSFGLIDGATGRDLGRMGDAMAGGRHDGNWGQSGRFIAITSNDGSVRVWDATTRKETASMRPHEGVT